MQIKTLDKYLMRELAAPFFIGLAAFLTILCLNMAYFVIDLIVEKGAPARDILQLIVLRAPFYLILAMPVAVLLATSLAINRITRDRELTALRMAGLSLWRLLAPFAIFGGTLTILSIVAQQWAAPMATHQSDTIYRRLLVASNVPNLQADTFFQAGMRKFYFRHSYRVGEHTLKLQGVMMFQMDGSNFPEMWSAREALVEHDVWTLKGVVMHHLDERGHASVDAVPGQDVVLDLHKDVSFLVSTEELPEEMTAGELATKIKNYQRMGATPLAIAPLIYDYYSKFAIPVACLLCAIIGIPLNIRFARLGGFAGLLLALVSVFLYYNCMLLARVLSYNGSVPAALGAWLPDLFFGVLCLVLVFRER